MTQNYTKIIIELHFYNLRKRSTAAQIPLTGHMRPAGRVFETAALNRQQINNLDRKT